MTMEIASKANTFKEFTVHSIRRLTADSQHNAFTGAAWFKGDLYVAHRQGDRHVCQEGRLIVLRSRDEGISFDTVAVLRGEFDTRDAHLRTDGDRLYVTGIEDTTDGKVYSGTAWTDDGLHWSPWTRHTGTDRYVMWRPQSFGGKHYCAGWRAHEMTPTPGTENYEFTATDVSWFESTDGWNWENKRVVHAGEDMPNETSFDFLPDGSVAMLMRREHTARTPLLLRSAPPYETWEKTELDVQLHGPALWFVDEDIWIAGRWYLNPYVTHIAMYKIVDDKPVMQLVLPSGPGGEIAYMGIAKHPLNKKRVSISYYSCHLAGDDATVSQWTHPDVYLADISFTAQFLSDWEVSDLLPDASLQSATVDQASGWKPLNAYGEEMAETPFFAYGFVDATLRIDKQAGVILFRKDVEVGPIDSGLLHLGFDGPITVRLNGTVVFEGQGTNPALPDEVTVPVKFRHGTNSLEIALETNGGKACGIFARYEAT